MLAVYPHAQAVTPGFSIRKKHLYASYPSITGMCGIIATMAWIHFISINLRAKSPWYSQDQSVLTKTRRRVGSGLKYNETNVSAMSPESWLRWIKKYTSAI
jgi:hypothetical protein